MEAAYPLSRVVPPRMLPANDVCLLTPCLAPVPLSRSTVPFVAKAVGHPIAKYASLLMSGEIKGA